MSGLNEEHSYNSSQSQTPISQQSHEIIIRSLEIHKITGNLKSHGFWKGIQVPFTICCAVKKNATGMPSLIWFRDAKVGEQRQKKRLSTPSI